jgi:C1A family cysteine protease
MKKRLGWRPDVPDARDYEYRPRALRRQSKIVDLRERFFKVWQQGDLGSCTAQTVAAACLYRDIYDRDMSIVVPSRLFIYYMTRSIEGTINSDAGAEIRNSIKAVADFGYPTEEEWPYKIPEFKIKPPANAQRKAKKEKIKRYERVSREISHFRKLLGDGYPIALGFSVYESVYTKKVDKSGIIPLPKKGEKLEGGHAVLAVGYDDERKALIIRNSWGASWGQKGYGYIPYAFIENSGLSDDFWVIR